MHEFELQFKIKVAQERKITNEILQMINEAEDRKIYLLRGYSGMHSWLCSFGYSESAAYRRRQAAEQLRWLPGIAEKLQSGALNLTTITQARTAMRRAGRKLSKSEQAEVMQRLENKSSYVANKILAQIFEREDSHTRLHLDMTEEAMADLKWAKDFLSHSIPDGDPAKVFARLLKDFRKNAVTAKPRVRIVLNRANRKCQYQDPETGRVCNSTYQVQVDHIVPKAYGGSDDLENLRCLCAAHNRFAWSQLKASTRIV